MSVSDNESNTTDNSLWKHHYPIDEDASTQHAEFVNLSRAMAFREKAADARPVRLSANAGRIFNPFTKPETDLNRSLRLPIASMPRHDDPADVLLP